MEMRLPPAWLSSNMASILSIRRQFMGAAAPRNLWAGRCGSVGIASSSMLRPSQFGEERSRGLCELGSCEVRQEFEDSLRRLGTEYVDLYQIQRPDNTLSIERATEVLLEFYAEGRVRAIGVSNFSAAQMDAFRSVAPMHLNQPPTTCLRARLMTTFCHTAKSTRLLF